VQRKTGYIITYNKWISLQLAAPFTVDSGSGVVRIRNILDYDVAQSYTLVIRAQVISLSYYSRGSVKKEERDVLHCINYL